VLVWDNLGGHTSAAMRALIASRPWLRVYPLPAYAPELNPVEKVWSHLKRSLANLAAELLWVADLERRSAISAEAVVLARRSGDPEPFADVRMP